MLPAVAAEAAAPGAGPDARPVPVRYVQLDAYWYESLPENMSFPGCIRGWRGMPSLFPGGVAAMRAKLGPGGGPAGSAMPLHLYHSFFCQPGGGDLPGGRPRNEYARHPCALTTTTDCF